MLINEKYAIIKGKNNKQKKHFNINAEKPFYKFLTSLDF